MITDQELLQLVVETKGQAEVEKLSGSVKKLDSDLKNAKKSAKELDDSTKKLGRGVLELSRAIEDAQYGFKGVVNNIPQLVTALGFGAGLAGAVSLVAIGVNQLINNWDKLSSAFGGTSPIKSAADQMKELAENTARTADETGKLLKLEEQQEQANANKTARNAMSQQLNPNVEKSQKSMKDVVAGIGEDNLSGFDRLKGALEMTPGVIEDFLNPEERSRIATLDAKIKELQADPNGAKLAAAFATGDGGIGLDPAIAMETQQKLIKEAQDKRARTLATAKADVIRRGDVGNVITEGVSGNPFALERLLNRIGSVRENNQKLYNDPNVDLPAGLEDQLRASTPEAVRRKEAEDAAKKKRDQMQKDGFAHDKILSDQQKAEDDAAKKAQTENEKFQKEQGKLRIRGAEDRLGGGLGANLERGLLTAELGGAGRDGAAQQMIAKLSLGIMKQAKMDGRDIREQEAQQIAEKQVRDAQESLDKKVTDEQLNPEQMKARKSEVFDATELAARIQSSFGTDNIPQKQLDTLKNIDQGIKALANNPARMTE